MVGGGHPHAQTLVHRYPGRVTRLVLAATAADPVAWPTWVTKPVFLIGRALARIDRMAAPRIAYRYLLTTGVIPPQHGAWLWESLLDRDVDLYYEAGFAILRFDGVDRIDAITMPTLFVIPTCDQLVPPARQRRAAKPVVAKLNLGSEYAFLDIKEGREELRRHLAAGRVVPIIIRGVIDAEGSGDDGISQEFDVHVEALEVGEPRKRGKGSYE